VLIIVELKTNSTISLLLQAVKRQKLTNDVYIAIPTLKIMKTRKWNDLTLLIKRLGLGLIVVYLNDILYAEVLIEPTLFDIVKSHKQAHRKRNQLLREFRGRSLDLNIGGSTQKKIMTAYKEQSLYIASCLIFLGPSSPKKLRLYGAPPKKTNSILAKNFHHWFYRVEKGIYDLTEDGINAIHLFQEITIIQKKEIEKISKMINIT